MDPDIFDDRRLNFRLRKPRDWRFVPAAWSPTAHIKRAEDFQDTLLRYAKLPFCCAMSHHESRAHAYPTLQVTAREATQYTKDVSESLLNSLIDTILSVHPTFEIEASSRSAELAGCQSLYVRGKFSLVIVPDGDEIEITVLSRSHVIFAPQATFTMGLSGSLDPNYYDEAEFNSILQSVCVLN